MKEEEIRPVLIFEKYLSLCRKDIDTFFSDKPEDRITCPACQMQGEFAFEKYGFRYELCPGCFTLFVNPRPSIEAFSRYYTESESAKFWASTFYKETAEARREKVWKPKAKKLLQKMKIFNAENYHVVDIGGGYGIFAEEMEKLSRHPVTVIEPGPSLAAVCRSKGLSVIEKFFDQIFFEELPAASKVFVSFELFEHLHDPAAFLKNVKTAMNGKDLLVFTTLSGHGIDILTLWEKSQSVFPPHHLNFFNPDSIRILLQRIGMTALEITTPGKLDVDLLCQHASKTDRFWKRFSKIADENTKQQWQSLISQSGWSSHMMVVCQKSDL